MSTDLLGRTGGWGHLSVPSLHLRGGQARTAPGIEDEPDPDGRKPLLEHGVYNWFTSSLTDLGTIANNAQTIYTSFAGNLDDFQNPRHRQRWNAVAPRPTRAAQCLRLRSTTSGPTELVPDDTAKFGFNCPCRDGAERRIPSPPATERSLGDSHRLAWRHLGAGCRETSDRRGEVWAEYARDWYQSANYFPARTTSTRSSGTTHAARRRTPHVGGSVPRCRRITHTLGSDGLQPSMVEYADDCRGVLCSVAAGRDVSSLWHGS
jgi:hypothetical protein